MSLSEQDIFIKACISGNISIIQKYIESEDDTNEIDISYCLSIAAENGQKEIVMYLLDTDVLIENNILIYPSRFGKLDIIKYLLNNFFTSEKIFSLYPDIIDKKDAYTNFIEDFIIESMKEAIKFKSLETFEFYNWYIENILYWYPYTEDKKQYFIEEYNKPITDEITRYIERYKIILEELLS